MNIILIAIYFEHSKLIVNKITLYELRHVPEGIAEGCPKP